MYSRSMKGLDERVSFACIFEIKENRNALVHCDDFNTLHLQSITEDDTTDTTY